MSYIKCVNSAGRERGLRNTVSSSYSPGSHTLTFVTNLANMDIIIFERHRKGSRFLLASLEISGGKPM